MKRKNYVITWGGNRAVKHAWNSALREAEAIVRGLAKSHGVTYRLTASGSDKDARGDHVRGFREWTPDNGAPVRFDIWRED